MGKLFNKFSKTLTMVVIAGSLLAPAVYSVLLLP